MTEDELKALRDALLRTCENYNADEAIRAMASAMTTLLIGCTADRETALLAFEKVVKAMLAHIEANARPGGTVQH